MAVVFTQTAADEDGRPVRDPASSSYLATFAPAAAVRHPDGRRGPPPRRRPHPPAGHPRRRRGLDLEPRRHALPRGHPDRRPVPRPRAPARPGQAAGVHARRPQAGLARRPARRARRRRHPRDLRRRPRLPPRRQESRATSTRPWATSSTTPTACATPTSGSWACSSAPAPSKPGAKSIIGSAANCPACDGPVPGATGILTLRCQEASDRWERNLDPARHGRTGRLTQHLTTAPHSDHPGQPTLPASHLHSCPTPDTAESTAKWPASELRSQRPLSGKSSGPAASTPPRADPAHLVTILALPGRRDPLELHHRVRRRPRRRWDPYRALQHPDAPHERDRRTLDRRMPPRAPGPHPHLEPSPSAADPAPVRDPPQSAPDAPLPGRSCAAETATPTCRSDRYHVRKQTRVSHFINEYRLVA